MLCLWGRGKVGACGTAGGSSAWPHNLRLSKFGRSTTCRWDSLVHLLSSMSHASDSIGARLGVNDSRILCIKWASAFGGGGGGGAILRKGSQSNNGVTWRATLMVGTLTRQWNGSIRLVGFTPKMTAFLAYPRAVK